MFSSVTSPRDDRWVSLLWLDSVMFHDSVAGGTASWLQLWLGHKKLGGGSCVELVMDVMSCHHCVWQFRDNTFDRLVLIKTWNCFCVTALDDWGSIVLRIGHFSFNHIPHSKDSKSPSIAGHWAALNAHSNVRRSGRWPASGSRMNGCAYYRDGRLTLEVTLSRSLSSARPNKVNFSL